MKSLFLSIVFILSMGICFGQKADSTFSTLDIVKFVQLDSLTVVASKKDFSPEDFIDLVKADTTFSQAFFNMRSAAFKAENRFNFFGLDNSVIASSEWSETQYYKENCRWTETKERRDQGRFYKVNGKQRFYTSFLFSTAFYSPVKRCGEKPGSEIDIHSLSGMAKRMEQLKRVIFNPGQEIEDMPFLGKRMAIFSEEMTKYYDYAIQSALSEDSIDCYVFIVREKEELRKGRKDKVILKYMESWFDKSDFHIISRSYHLKNENMIFDFDVQMDIDLQEVQGLDFIKNISYNGYWDIPTMKAENCKADISFEVSDAE